MKFYYNGGCKIYKIEGKLHKKILLYNKNYKHHIKTKHPEVNLDKIKEILKEPDYVYKSSRNSKVRYYEKLYKCNTYRVVVEKKESGIREVVTSYKLDKEKEFTKKYIYCIYTKEDEFRYKEKLDNLWDDMDYFYKAFTCS